MPIQPATLGVGSSLPPRFQGVSDDELVMAFHRLAAGVLITVFVTVTGPHGHQTPDLPTIGAGLYLLAGLAMIGPFAIDTVFPAFQAIGREFAAGEAAMQQVTSAYLLAYAVPVLITGRLGDRFGPKRLYMSGLTVFTLASLWCGLTGSIEMLIAARVVQGLGASMITPQTMAIITRIFPVARRGTAMGLWGATAGVAGEL